MPELDVPAIVIPSLKYQSDIIAKIREGALEQALDTVKGWLTPEQKDGVKSVGDELLRLYEPQN
jgi:hypothetical protein